MLVLNTLILGQHEFFKKAPQSGKENPDPVLEDLPDDPGE